MPSTLPKEIKVEAIRDDVSYSLPRRPLGNYRWIGLLFIAFSVFFIFTGPSSDVFGLIKDFKDFAASKNWLGIAMLLMALIPLKLGALVPACLGCLIMFGSCRVEWRDKRLIVVDHAGPLRWRRHLSKGGRHLRKLSVGFGQTEADNQPTTTGPFANLRTLVAEFDRGNPRIVAAEYPKDWLHALAEDLSARVGAASTGMIAPKVQLGDGRETDSDFELVEKPAGSTVRVETTANGLNMVVPPAGIWKGSKGLFGFAIVWCVFMSVSSTLFLQTHGAPLIVWLFIGGFWAIGIGMLAGAINMGKRRALLLAEGGQLKVAQKGLFGTKQWEWQRGDIAAVRADANGMEVNHRSVIELQIHPVKGKKVGLFAGRNEDELRWMAAELRRTLGTPARTDG